MSDRQTLTRAERLRTIGVIRRLFSEGESRFVYPFRIVWLPAQAPATNRATASATARTTETAPITDQAQEAVQVCETARPSATAPATSQAPETAPETDQVPANAQVGEIARAPATAQATAQGMANAQDATTAQATAAPAPATAGVGLRVLFSVPKKYHKRANRRNLLRRRTKEAYRLQKSLLQLDKSYDIALIYTSREVESYDRIAHAVRKIIDHLNALGR